MSDYISRERAANIFSRARAAMKPSDYRTFDEMNTRDLMLLNAEQAINAVPAADVVEARHGRWVKMTGMMPPEYHGHYECSLCKWHGKYTFERERDYDFCPNCGARMNESEDEGEDGENEL